MDYVFEEAKDGDRCFADCAYARNLKARYRYNVSTVERRAAELHSKTTSSRWGTGMERPEDERKRAKKSLKAELKEINAEKENVYSLASDEDSHVLVCVKCHKKTKLEGCPYHEANQRIEEKTGFAILDHSTEIYGVCPQCQKNDK